MLFATSVTSLALLTAVRAALPSNPTDFKLITWNLRYDSKPDNITVQTSLNNMPNPMVEPAFLGYTGEQPWSTRRIKVAQEVIHSGAVVASFQEALVRQVNDMQTLLGSNWAWCGVGRDDGVAAGEFNPIFYDKTQVKLTSNDTFWLSNTPSTPSKYPGAGSYRIANVAHFQWVNGAAAPFTLINTHLDDQSDAQRRLGASLILYRARYEAASSQRPVLLTGDFNSAPYGSDSGAYNITTGIFPPVAIPLTFQIKYAVLNGLYPNFIMQDTRAQTPKFAVSGFYRSMAGFNNPMGQTNFDRIDYVFGGNNGGWTSMSYKTPAMVADDGILASDHRPVVVELAAP